MLSPHESLLLATLRSMPPERQALLARGCARLLEITDHAGTCAGPGVDGFPCGEPQACCEYCHMLTQAMESLGH